MAKGNTTKILLATLAGLTAGVAVGLLLAPEEGAKTRKKLKKKLGEVVENLQHEFSGDFEKLKSVFPGIDKEKKPKKNVKTTSKNPTT